MKIIIDENRVMELKKLSIETESRKEIISLMLSRNMNISTDQFQNYQNEYKKYFIEYENQKKKIENDFVYSNCPNAKSWFLDFDKCELNIIE